MRNTELVKMNDEELNLVVGGEAAEESGTSVLRYFYEDLGFGKVALEWYLYWNTPKKGSSDGEGGIIHF